MRKYLYQKITDRLRRLVPEIKHYDLWNQNVEYLESEAVFDTPAVFVEFAPIRWATLSGSVQQAEVTFNLHVVTSAPAPTAIGSSYEEEALRVFDLLDKIAAALQGMCVSSCQGCMRTGSLTNHNHEEIREDIETFSIHVKGELRL